MKPNPKAVCIDKVIVDELTDICNRRGQDPPQCEQSKWKQECHDMQLFGISLSGGGIRSATFGLGVLQGLAEKELLAQADYVSTVSGGGYIGSWLQGVLHRYPDKGYEKIKPQFPDAAASNPISFLRKYSNYLAPRVGLSLDAIVIPVIWLRNMLLNQTIIISAIGALFLLLSFPGGGIRAAAYFNNACFSWTMMFLALLLGAVAVIAIGYNLRTITNREFTGAEATAFQAGKGTENVGKLVVLPLALATVFLLLALTSSSGSLSSLSRLVRSLSMAFQGDFRALQEGIGGAFFPWILLVFILWLLLALMQWGGGFVECFTRRRGRWLAHFHVLWMSSASALLIWALFVALSLSFDSWRPDLAEGAQYTIGLMPPLYLIALMLGLTLQIGLMGRDFPDSTREWLARTGALTWIVVSVWLGLFAIAVFSPFWVAKLWVTSGAAIVSAVGTWVASTVVTVLAGKSAKTGGEKAKAGKSVSLDAIARYGPFIAVPGFLIVIAFGVQALLRINLKNPPGLFLGKFLGSYWAAFPHAYASWKYPLILFAGAVIVFVVLSLRVDINEFSLHHFYKNRLVRCYMGASMSKDRKPDPFTGFDPRDDVPLADLRCDAKPQIRSPYPILNATLTITEGSELATQERKAVPWIFTPRYSGFIPPPTRANEEANKQLSRNGFVRTSEILGGGVHLGTAMGISGAALNPSSGFHSAPQTAFLLTLFDVRLGWWTGNPRNLTTYRRPGPLFSLWWLTRELLGFVDERSAYLNLSDGGNFENLGLYELIRRRCHFVIAVDGEEDPTYAFTSLGGAVRKCRTDFGVEIDIDPQAIQPKNGFNGAHCVVGRIRYPEPDSPPGWLLYIKASLTGDEPADVQEYRRQHAEFPQQSTLQQFFSESQFESYRRLGLHILRTTIDRSGPAQLEDLFQRLAVRWELAPPAPDGAAARHADAYSKLMHFLMNSSDLEKLASQVIENYPVTQAGDKAQRELFLFHLDLLELMKNIFFDLNFTSEYCWNHPANAGWKRIFEYWAKQESLKTVWEAHKTSYSAPFQNFFDDLGRDVAPPEGRRI